MKYRKNDGQESVLTFGSYPAVTLEQARKMRDEAKSQKAVRFDLGVARREEKAERITVAKNTFEAVSREWMEIHVTKVKPKTLHLYRALLEKFVFPLIGKMPIRDMKAPDFLSMLRRVEEQGQVYSARRISVTCGLIMRFAVATERADADPMPSLRGSLKAHKTPNTLPVQSTRNRLSVCYA